MTTHAHPETGPVAASALPQIHAYVEAVERLMEDPAWDGTLPPPVDLAAASDLTLGELPAAQALLERAARTEAGLQRRMALVLSELGGMGSRKGAARAYVVNDAPA
jgi:hypothetical protein